MKGGNMVFGSAGKIQHSGSAGIVCMSINPLLKKNKHISFHGTSNVAGMLWSNKHNCKRVVLPLGGI